MLRRVEHVDQTVPGNGREQQQKSDCFDDNEDNNDGAQSRDAITVLKEHTVDEDNDAADCRSS